PLFRSQHAAQRIFGGTVPERRAAHIRGATQQVAGHRSGQQQEDQRNRHLAPGGGRAVSQCDADQHQSAAGHAGLRRGMHPHEEVRKTQHSDRCEQADRRTGEQEEAGEQRAHDSSPRGREPRSMKPAKATMARKPTNATPSATSTKAAEPVTTAARPAAAIPRSDSMSSATTRSATCGPRAMRTPAMAMAPSNSSAHPMMAMSKATAPFMAIPPGRFARSRP